jgi:hypothetical protein
LHDALSEYARLHHPGPTWTIISHDDFDKILDAKVVDKSRYLSLKMTADRDIYGGRRKCQVTGHFGQRCRYPCPWRTNEIESQNRHYRPQRRPETVDRFENDSVHGEHKTSDPDVKRGSEDGRDRHHGRDNLLGLAHVALTHAKTAANTKKGRATLTARPLLSHPLRLS